MNSLVRVTDELDEARYYNVTLQGDKYVAFDHWSDKRLLCVNLTNSGYEIDAEGYTFRLSHKEWEVLRVLMVVIDHDDEGVNIEVKDGLNNEEAGNEYK